MGTVELPELEKKVLPDCKFVWSQKVINQANKILIVCDTEDKIKTFFKNCEDSIRNPDKYCRIVWNTEVYRFGGSDFGYVMYFYSELLKAPIKVCLKIDVLDFTVTVGEMEIATKKEERKLEKSLNTTMPLNSQEVKK